MSDLWFDYDASMYTNNTAANISSAREPSSELGKDAFLQLLVAQMQYQDPLNPMDNSQMLSQMAQFSALEQMQNVSKSTIQSMAFSMIGKMVEGTMPGSSGENESIVGLVSSVLVQNGNTYLSVGDKLLQADKVTNVYTDPITSINSNIANSQSFNLIGKTIQAITLDSEYNASGFVEGKVDYVKFSSNGSTILVVGNKEVYPSEVVSVGTENLLIGMDIYREVQNEEGVFELVPQKVTDVIIRDEKAYLKFGGEEVFIEKINYATDALALIGTDITHSGISGTVSAVILRDDGVPYLKVGESEISYKEFKNISEE